jgi:hypothetical protein
VAAGGACIFLPRCLPIKPKWRYHPFKLQCLSLFISRCCSKNFCHLPKRYLPMTGGRRDFSSQRGRFDWPISIDVVLGTKPTRQIPSLTGFSFFHDADHTFSFSSKTKTLLLNQSPWTALSTLSPSLQRPHNHHPRPWPTPGHLFAFKRLECRLLRPVSPLVRPAEIEELPPTSVLLPMIVSSPIALEWTLVLPW